MAKFIPTNGNVSVNAVTYYAIDIVMSETSERADVTDGNTGAGGREYLTGRAERTLTFRTWVDDGTAELAHGASGAIVVIMKTGGTTDKKYTYTNGIVINKTLNGNPAGNEGVFAEYEIALDGSPTAVQYT